MWALKERGKTGEKHEKGGKMGGWIAGRQAQGHFPDATKMIGSGRGV